jgi:hypothetical protein
MLALPFHANRGPFTRRRSHLQHGHNQNDNRNHRHPQDLVPHSLTSANKTRRQQRRHLLAFAKSKEFRKNRARWAHRLPLTTKLDQRAKPSIFMAGGPTVIRHDFG